MYVFFLLFLFLRRSNVKRLAKQSILMHRSNDNERRKANRTKYKRKTQTHSRILATILLTWCYVVTEMRRRMIMRPWSSCRRKFHLIYINIAVAFSQNSMLNFSWLPFDVIQISDKLGLRYAQTMYAWKCLNLPWEFPKCNSLSWSKWPQPTVWLSFDSYKIFARHMESPWKYKFVPRAGKYFPEKLNCNGNRNRFRDAKLKRSFCENLNILEMCWMPKVSQSDNSSIEFTKSNENTRICSFGATSVPPVTVIPNTIVNSMESNGQLTRNRHNQSWSISMDEEYLCPVDKQQNDSQQWTSVSVTVLMLSILCPKTFIEDNNHRRRSGLYGVAWYYFRVKLNVLFHGWIQKKSHLVWLSLVLKSSHSLQFPYCYCSYRRLKVTLSAHRIILHTSNTCQVFSKIKCNQI